MAAFSALVFAAPFGSPALFAAGVLLIGLGAGLFAHCTLTAAMAMAEPGQVGLTLGIWGAVQASAAGQRRRPGRPDPRRGGGLAQAGAFGPTLVNPATGYVAVYAIEIALLFGTLIAIGPLVRSDAGSPILLPSSP